jgi:excisionase family DNA binding protein
MTPVQDPLRSVVQVSERLGVRPVTVRKKLARRELACVKIGRRVLIPESEIQRLITEGTIPALAQDLR